MNVTLRKRISKKTSRVTLYLDIYKGYTISINGKSKQEREYIYLKYYLISEPKTAADKQHNKENLKGAEAVRAKYILDIQNETYGFTSKIAKDASLLEYFKKLTLDRYKSEGNYGNWKSALKHLINYCGDQPTFKEIDIRFVEGFKEYLQFKAKTKSEKLLSTNSALSYFNKFRTVINEAFEVGLISSNPVKRVKGIKEEETHREYLTFDELKKLSRTECRYEILKKAFLFSCLTGLRWSDINKLIWKEIHEDNGSYKIHLIQKKTKTVEYTHISEQAVNLLGQRGQPEHRVFHGLKYSSYTNAEITRWTAAAGVTRHITFHCARHTFATLQLTFGTELLTISKLLGHKNLKTTQIYTKIIDEKKQEAVNKIPNISL